MKILTIDNSQLNLDIEKYGLFEDYKKWGYTEEQYDFMNLRYLKIALAKGLVNIQEKINTNIEYLEYRNKQ